MGGDEALGRLMHKDTKFVRSKKEAVSHFRKEGLSVLTSFLLFLEYLLGKKRAVFWGFVLLVVFCFVLFLS